MRWLHLDEDDPIETAQRAGTLERIDTFWRAFESRRADIEAHMHGTAWDLPAFMAEHLRAIDPRLEWEYGPACAIEGHRLVVTPAFAHALLPMVRTLVDRAPRIPGWEFHARHPPNAYDHAMRIVTGRAGVDLAGTTVEVTRQPWGRLDLRFFLPRKLDVSDERAGGAVALAAQSLLGEEVLHQWVGDIEVERQGRFHWLSVGARPREDVPLAQLPALAERQLTRLREERPALPCIDREDDDWRLFEVPKEKWPKGTEHPARSDMYLGKSEMPTLWFAAHHGLTFTSENFSRHGEVFCYVKTDGSKGLEGSAYEDKGDIEEALDEPLRAARAGCFIGGGTGLRYSYVDLALLDVEAGVRIVRDVLRQGNINRRTWILFFDDTLADEWIGVFPDSPPPPRAPDTAP